MGATGLVNNDTLSGGLEDLGRPVLQWSASCAINQEGTLTNANYAITYTGAEPCPVTPEDDHSGGGCPKQSGYGDRQSITLDLA